MATVLLNLRHVPDDEAEEVRRLLEAHRIDYYETPPGPWGVSMGAIWLKDDAQRDEANRLIGEYQAERARKVRAAYEERKREGRSESFLGRIRQRPLQTLVYAAIIGFVVYFSVKPFFSLGQ
ncbi:MAG: hypothetical protein GWN84_09735 [Gammaproteobacteria bacterium]|nr:hypothetical protein [Gammaproteobacteria bacterium]NIR83145.1 hypothetical protein [Gammaproteobacteria bacterium]NIR90953.1 hypothetical protein [Gammaproteobacteria bacterium]NIU04310.1 hypothetical protein [Gammaproteobacteria bacterium]NIV52533.1 hypothetical protein [Gammaproteobacteria bacterium]